ncbi:MAG: thrombospondin type 3 repeat-containing protein [Myxococcales bacterium]
MAAAVGCVDGNPAPVPVPVPLARHSSALIADQQHGGGPVGFFFLTPVVPAPPSVFSGAFESRLAPTVRIDRIDPVTGTTLSTVTTLTPLTAEKVRRNPARELYIVRWQTGRYSLSPRSSYRIRVLVGDRELGIADVRVVTRESDLRGMDTSHFVGVRYGDILPIRFRIEQGAVDRDNDGVFDWVDNCVTVPNATGSSTPPQAPPVMRLPPRCNPDRSACDPQEVDCLSPVRLTQVDTDGDGTGDACECLNVTCAPADLCHGAARCDDKTGTCIQPPLLDQDGDRECDATDGCPSDVAKTTPGQCGCGVSDVDSDGDGMADCLDACPSDRAKVNPGVCGCGVPDSDGDQDGVLDCNDACPADTTKTGAGSCGCGTPDIDSDGDGTADCLDTCPVDPRKVAPGLCGCSVADLDSDLDGVVDCLDGCPTDVAKLGPGVCGCGRSDADSDLDGVPDCEDVCPLDRAKQSAGACGCGQVDRDSDSDGTPDCHDACPTDRGKVQTGVCGCGVLDSDSDGDGTADCVDLCPADPAKAHAGPCRTQDGGVAAADAAIVDAGVADASVADAVAVEGGARDGKKAGGGVSHVDITWLSISNVYYELGPLNIMTDGYITRIPMSNFFGGRGGLAFTHTPNLPDVAAVRRVLDALGGPLKVNLLLTGHSHFDHSFDTATWSSLTGARIIGSKTTCFQAIAQQIASDHCRVVVGGERFTLAEGVTMRVVRWNHSGDATSNPEQHNPIELNAMPIPDPATGGLHGGVSEDFPNGGGGRGYLFTVQGSDGPFSWFFQNSANAGDLEVPIVIDGVDYGAPLQNLRAAMADAGLDSVDLWIGTGGAAVARLVLPVIHPRAYLPVHWDGLYGPFLNGVTGRGYSDAALATLLTTSGVKLLTPVQYMDKWRLDRSGVQPMPNTAVKQALGFTK